MPERDTSANTTIGRRTNGKAGIQQPQQPQQQAQQQQQQAQQIKSRQQSQPQRPASKSMDYPTGKGSNNLYKKTTIHLQTTSLIQGTNRRARSKSTDQLHHPDKNDNCHLDSGTLKKMLKPVQTAPDSPVTSPEGGGRRRGNLKLNGGPHSGMTLPKYDR